MRDSGCYMLDRDVREPRPRRCVLERNCTNHPICVEIDDSVFTKIMSIDDRCCPEFNVDSVCIGEITDFHGLNRRSRNAL